MTLLEQNQSFEDGILAVITRCIYDKSYNGQIQWRASALCQHGTVAQILERERDPLIHEWLGLVEKQEDLRAVPLNYEDRTGHCPNC
jgi:hypothetical protein